MHVNVQLRFNPNIGCEAPYYRLKESYRSVDGAVHSLIVLNIGFEPALKPHQMHRIAQALTSRFANRRYPLMFEELDGLTDEERKYAESYWKRMIDEGHIDRFNKKEAVANKEKEKYIDLDTVEHTDARDVGAEWLCKQTIDRLGLEDFLISKGWTQTQVWTALSHLIVRTVYSPSEFATHKYMRDNSAACELYSGDPGWVPGINSIYDVADRFYEIKDELESYLCQRTDDLFNCKNRIILYDLTNFYFEGAKRGSKKSKFGRSKEKRGDCKLLVLALAINTDGFIKYSSVLEGNTADPKSLPDMIDKIASSGRVRSGDSKALVVIDAGIASEENLRLIKSKGYNYLCVARSKPKNYTLAPDCKSVTVQDSRKRDITLREVHTESDGDYYLEITSPSKAMTEASMNRAFREGFESLMNTINASIGKKGGIKTYEKVIERVGRASQRYPSIAKFYDISYIRDEENPKQMKEVQWQIKDLEGMEKSSGVYFLRTNVRTLDEKTTWEYYNLIRDIETTNRQIKLDLNLRPIYHQKDERSDAHLFLGLLSYWVVNSIRTWLKEKGENAYWTEIVRRMKTQKLVTTHGVNALGEKVELRQCSKPSTQAEDIYKMLNFKPAPFKKIKICRSQEPPD